MEIAIRVLSLRLDPNSEQWKTLRQRAYLCASFGNHLLTEQYAEAKGLSGLTPYTDYRDSLSSYVRDAVSREVVGLWRRLGRKILRGEQTLARFSADRALVVRERGAELIEKEGRLFLWLRVDPKGMEALEIPVHTRTLRRSAWTRGLAEKIKSGECPLTKVSIVFDKWHGRTFARIAYEKPIEEQKKEGLKAIIVFSAIYQRAQILCEGKSWSFNNYIYRLSTKKAELEAIRQRAKASKQKNRRKLRRLLHQIGSYDEWAGGILHQLSHKLVEWARTQQAAEIVWTMDHDGSLPLDRLRAMVEYKAIDRGIKFSQTKPDSEQKSSLRGKEVSGQAKESGNIQETKRSQ